MWLCQTDHQMVGAASKGLAHFQQPADPTLRGPWDWWPLLSMSSDQGTKETAGTNVCMHKLGLNCDSFCDPGHAVWNDCKRALRESGHWSHTCLMMLSWNVRHGPWCEDFRMQEVVGCFKIFLKVNTCPRLGLAGVPATMLGSLAWFPWKACFC